MTSRKLKALCVIFLLFLNMLLLCAEEIKIYSDSNIKVKKNPVTFTPDNKYILTSFGTNGLHKIELVTGSVHTLFDSIESFFEEANMTNHIVMHIEISFDKKYLGIISGNPSGDVSIDLKNAYLVIFELDNMKVVFKQKVFNNYLKPQPELFVSNSNICVFLMPTKISEWVFGKYYSEVEICTYDIDKRAYLSRFKYNINGTEIYDIAVNRSLQNIVISFLPDTVEVFDFNGNKIKAIPRKNFGMLFIFTPDGKFLINEKGDIWDAHTYREITSKNQGWYPFTDGWYTLTDDEKYLSSGAVIYSLDVDNFGEEVFQVNGKQVPSDLLKIYSFSSDMKYIVFGCSDRTVRIYNTNLSKKDEKKDVLDYIYKTSYFDDGEWISLTPDGYYNASIHGDEHLNVRYGLNTFGLNQFSKAYYHPEVLEARSRGEKDPNIVRYFGDLKLSVAPPIVKVEEKLTGTVAKLSVTVLDPALKYPLDSVQIFINGRMLSFSELSKAKGKKIAVSDTSIVPKDKASNFLNFEIEVDLEHGENLIEVLADNEACYGMQTINLTSNEMTHKTKPDLWIYAIGINDYDSLPKNRPNNGSGLIDLKNAVSDSNKIIEIFKSQKGKTYNKIHVLQLSDDSALKPTKQTIKENMAFFEKMAPNDIAVFFVAAHGISVNGSFYILPKDVFVDLDGLHPNLNGCLNVNDILQVTNIHGRKLILIDTCQSGGIDNNIVVRTLKNRSTAIFTAAREYEYAQESEDVGGHFTHSIVSCVKENKNNDICLLDLSNYVYDEVKQLSKFGGRGRIRQHPEILIPDGMKNYIIAK
ncbi:hypothetical protein E4O04_01335 [Treponema sp. OMZ 799]|uniref:caspase family protein n=1 Tax=Treponema sp. OMZ 799 TaxID=2563668 RepID=UPI0020A2A434|nr:caspase family protein [Treponema sp. OMZ 799]UTC76727.1 hypothetical protein E4O04_01335 [Treponema sp. OMZ 799]